MSIVLWLRNLDHSIKINQKDFFFTPKALKSKTFYEHGNKKSKKEMTKQFKVSHNKNTRIILRRI